MDIHARCDFSFVIISSVKRKQIKCSYKKMSVSSLSLSRLYQWHPFRPFSAHFEALGQIRGHVWCKRQVIVPESHIYHEKLSMEHQLNILVIDVRTVLQDKNRRSKVKVKVMCRCETSDRSLMCHHAVNLGSVKSWKTEKGLNLVSTEQPKRVARVWIYVPWKHVIYQHTSANPIGRKHLAGRTMGLYTDKLCNSQRLSEEQSITQWSMSWRTGPICKSRPAPMCFGNVLKHLVEKVKGAVANQKKKTIFSFLGQKISWSQF